MRNKTHISNKIPGSEGKPYKVPEGYFDEFESRLMERIAKEAKNEPEKKRISLRPYIALAASISGIALITVTLLQFALGSRWSNTDYYDLALLEEAGIVQNELLLSDNYFSNEWDEDDAWDEEMMNYLASNEIDLDYLLASN